MQIRVNRGSEVPLREQVAEQIILQIVTEELKPGEVLPSVRELARRLKIHHNTVSHAYRDLVRRHWLAGRRGSRLLVRHSNPFADRLGRQGSDLDDLINATIEAAHRQGYSLQALRARVRERLFAQPPDHILVVEQEEGLRNVLRQEVARVIGWPVETCSRDQLQQNHGLAIGALVVTPRHALADVEPLVPKARPPVPVSYSSAEEYLAMIQELDEPSVIAVVSVSELFLKTARGVLVPILGDQHTLREVLLSREDNPELQGADLVFCDSVACDKVRHRRRVEYRLVAEPSLQYVFSAMESYRDG